MDERLAAFLARKRFPGGVIFAKIWGSHSHNLNLPTSDVDFTVIYAADAKAMLSLDPPPDTVDGKKPDFQAHEAKKFCDLLLKGNPGILECLFTDRLYVGGGEWNALVEARRKFLSRRAVAQYLGYATGQLKRLRNDQSLHTSGGEFREKWGFHMIRLLLDGERIACGGEPLVWKEEGSPERNYLMKIRAGEVSKEEIETKAQELIDKIDATDQSRLPEVGDREFLNRWLLILRGVNPDYTPGR